MNLAYRWFCGLGLEDTVPHHSTFSVNRPLANHPYRRLGARHAPEPAPRRLPATVKVERRPLSIYTEALQ